MRSRRSTRSSSSGFTIIELLIGLVITLGVTTAGLALARSSLGLYQTDQGRVRLHQNLRAAHDSLTADIRQAGERLGPTFPAIEVVPGAVEGAPDELILRRNLLGVVMRVCEDISGTQSWINVGWEESLEPGCIRLAGGENLAAWEAFRTSAGGEILAYVSDPVDDEGEFVRYVGEQALPLADMLWLEPGTTFENEYSVAAQSQVFLIEQRRYRLEGGLLQVVVNEDAAAPLNLVDAIEDFQVRVFLQADPPDEPPPPAQDTLGGATWTDLRSIEVTVAGRVETRNHVFDRLWSTRVVPRNVMSF
jgi:type IV pilus assembly protein PilW